MRDTRQFIVVAVGLVATLVLAACGGEATKDLQTLKGEGFTVSMPGQPERSVQSVKSAVGPVRVVAYISDGDDLAYSVSYTEIPSGVKGDLSGAVKGAAANTGGTVRDNLETRYQGFPARDARITGVANHEGTSFTRVILAKGRLYQLQVVQKGADRGAPPPAYPKFVASLRIS